jgi:hypothetical protein
MKIAILSDSHRKTDLTLDALSMLKDKGARYLIHAGDLEIEENLEALKNSGLTYVSVFGNNDHDLIQHQHKYNIKKEPYYFKIKDLKFKLMHLPYYLTGDTDIIIYGHTHRFEHKFINGRLFLNPGEICARNKNLTECVLLHITEKEYIINYYFKKPGHSQWEEKIISYPLDK